MSKLDLLSFGGNILLVVKFLLNLELDTLDHIGHVRVRRLTVGLTFSNSMSRPVIFTS